MRSLADLPTLVASLVGVVLALLMVPATAAAQPATAPDASPVPPATTLATILAHDPHAIVRALRPGERLVVADRRTEDPAWGGRGARASLFVADGASWRHVGDVDSKYETSDVDLVRVDPDGVAILAEYYPHMGSPESRVYAIALVDGRIDTADSGDVARVDTQPRGAPRDVRLWRRPANLNPFALEEPLHLARWQVRRTADGLVASEESLTPWVDVLAAFCTGAHPELADGAVLAQVDGCLQQPSTTMRRARTGDIIATLGLRMYCGASESTEEVEARLVLRRRPAGWRIVWARGCK